MVAATFWRGAAILGVMHHPRPSKAMTIAMVVTGRLIVRIQPPSRIMNKTMPMIMTSSRLTGQMVLQYHNRDNTIS
jgi:hypothetical protein